MFNLSKFKEQLFLFLREKLTPNLIFIYLHIIHFFSKIVEINAESYLQFEQTQQSFVFSVWHGRQFSPMFKHKKKNIAVLVSPSRDGNVQAAFLHKFGYQTIRGSSDKQPVKSLIKMIKLAKQTKCLFTFAVDGPRGPVFKVKPGIISFAAKTGYPIIPVTTDATFKITIKTWDKCIIPLPFSKIVIVYGSPIYVRDEKEDTTQYLEILQTEMEKINSLADEYLKNLKV